MTSTILSPKLSNRSTTTPIPPNSTTKTTNSTPLKSNITHVDTLQENIPPQTPTLLLQTPQPHDSSLNSSTLSSCSSTSSKRTRSSSFSSSSKHSERIKNHPIIVEAKNLLSQRKWNSVVDVLDSTLREGTENRYIMAESAYLSGIAFRSLEKFVKAKEYLLLARKYKHQRALNALGVVCQQEGEFDEALRWYREAQQKFPNDSSAFYNAGLILFNKGKQLRKEIEEKKLLQSQDAVVEGEQDSDPHSQSSVAIVSTQQDQLAQQQRNLQKTNGAAQKMFEKAARRGHVLAYFQLGSLTSSEKQYDHAFRYFSKGARKGEPSCIVSLAELYLASHVSGTTPENAREDARRLLHEASVRFGHLGARLLLAKMAHSDEKYALAMEYFQLVEHFAEAKFYMGIMYFEGMGCSADFNKAKILLEHVLESVPKAAYYLAKIYSTEENKERTVHYLEICLRTAQLDATLQKEAREMLESYDNLCKKEEACIEEFVDEQVVEREDSSLLNEEDATSADTPEEQNNLSLNSTEPLSQIEEHAQDMQESALPAIDSPQPAVCGTSTLTVLVTSALAAGLMGFLVYWRMRPHKFAASQ